MPLWVIEMEVLGQGLVAEGHLPVATESYQAVGELIQVQRDQPMFLVFRFAANQGPTKEKTTRCYHLASHFVKTQVPFRLVSFRLVASHPVLSEGRS